MTMFLRLQEDIEDRQMEWANLKCRWATYWGLWPEWVDGVVVPSWEDIHQLGREFDRAKPYSRAGLLRGRNT